MTIQAYMKTVGEAARASAEQLAYTSTKTKNQALRLISKELIANKQRLLSANQTDMELGKQNNLDNALADRLELNETRIEAMADGLNQVAELVDPIGEIHHLSEKPSGIKVGKMRVPLGVVGIIYESRPNVTADAAALCLKSGNAAILRGGSEALYSNQAIAECIATGLHAVELPTAAVQVINTTDREAVSALLTMPQYVDIIIPRGGKGLIEHVSKTAKIPVIKHLDGICHVYIDNEADLDMAINIAFNAKTQRYGTCNAMECLLVAEQNAKAILSKLDQLYKEAGVEIRGCDKTQSILPDCQQATETDYATEYLAPILSVKIVAGIDEAIQHIAQYGSQHTDSIITANLHHANRFLREIDSSSVMVNTSTRFADGFEYGLGAEIGISTDKFHARGPVGLEGLTSEKYIVMSDGKIRQ